MTGKTQVRHGANVLRALAKNLEATVGTGGFAPPLDHASARDALTLLTWHEDPTSDTLQFALGLSQPACVRLVDRLVDAGLVVRERRPADRRLHLSLTAPGRRAATTVLRRSREPVEEALRAALPDSADLGEFVAALDRLANVVFGEATDTARFCRSCDVDACLAGGGECPSDEACKAALDR
jgi:DNA-binding MarR family transcriptional regulator